jgi:hypothetical protein
MRRVKASKVAPVGDAILELGGQSPGLRAIRYSFVVEEYLSRFLEFLNDL